MSLFLAQLLGHMLTVPTWMAADRERVRARHGTGALVHQQAPHQYIVRVSVHILLG